MDSKGEIITSRFAHLADYLQAYNQMQFSGKVDVQTVRGKSWSIYYWLGRIVWATGGVHPHRRWYRNLTLHCPHLNPHAIRLREGHHLPEFWDYHVLTILTKRRQISTEQAIKIVKSTVVEVLFDLLVQMGSKSFKSTNNPEITIDQPLTLLNVEQVLACTQRQWRIWCQASLAALSPNLAPKITNPQQLQKQVSPNVYKNLTSLIDGQHSLRDLAVESNKELLVLTRSLVTQIRKGTISLREIPDVPSNLISNKQLSKTNQSAPTNAKKPLVACIDDSPQVCQQMRQIITTVGYQFMSIQDPLKAVSSLIERKPDIIFLDLVMPVANGYEICAQLRRVNNFKQTPIVIFTSNDRVVDRIRAKVVKASDFIAKPIEAEKVISTLEKFFPQDKSIRTNQDSGTGLEKKHSFAVSSI